MRLVTFTAGTGARFGVWDGDRVVEPDVVARAQERRRAGESAASATPPQATDMVAFFADGSDGRARAGAALDAVREADRRGDVPDGVHPLAGVRLLAPVPRPRRIRDYLTYTAHATGSGLTPPPAMTAMPICYQVNVESVIGPDDPVVWPSYTDQLDFELEIGFFTGAGGRDLTPAQAAERIAGVTIFNDVSARDIQLFEMGLSIGPSKGKDFCNVLGPCVLTMDEVDEWSIGVRARINGETWASGSTAGRQFSFAEVLAWASLDEDVHPGEFLALGTVGGCCGFELDRWLRPGDVVELEADGIGVLRNTIGAKQVVGPGAGVASYHGAPRATATHG